MCQICDLYQNNYDQIIKLRPCHKIKFLPNGLVNLEDLDIHNTDISDLPSDMIKLQKIYARNSYINNIPDTFINLTELYIPNTKIEKLPITLNNLQFLLYFNTPLDNNHTKIQLKKIYPKLIMIKNETPFYNIKQINDYLENNLLRTI